MDIGGNLGDIKYMINSFFPYINIYTESVPNYYKHLITRLKEKGIFTSTM